MTARVSLALQQGIQKLRRQAACFSSGADLVQNFPERAGGEFPQAEAKQKLKLKPATFLGGGFGENAARVRIDFD